MRVSQTELDGLPEKRQIARYHRHRKGDRQVDFTATLDGAQTSRPQIRAAQSMLAFELHTVELQIKLKIAAADDLREPGEKLIVVNDAHAVGVEQKVVDAGIALNPFDELKKPWMQRRLAAGKLEDFNSSFAVND